MSNLRLSYLQKVGGGGAGNVCTGHPPGIYASGRRYITDTVLMRQNSQQVSTIHIFTQTQRALLSEAYKGGSFNGACIDFLWVGTEYQCGVNFNPKFNEIVMSIKL